ncbi:MAG: PEP-CTERM sorting domain-containing protein [Sphingomonadaceae bacterium]|nr:PEP-CTERM sorting domain-containing protein [Sphingomonadaceae bacterium]
MSACTGSNLLLAGRATGSSTLLVLAQALKSDVLFDTGNNTGATHSANGTEWYNHDNFSLGFVDPAHTVNKSICDVGTTGGLRLCIHTITSTGGFRINDITNLNVSTAYEKLAFTSNGAVPEPAAWALMIAGFGLVGASLRRRRTGYATA